MDEDKFTAKAKASLEKVIEAFRDGSIAAKCAMATYPMPKIPAATWSLHNRWLCLLQAGQVDCRGFRQWEEVGRKVKKGGRAVFILRPRTVKSVDEESGEDEIRCVGFSPIAVFPINQTEGEPVEYENLKLPELPLMNVAASWGIEVIPQPFTMEYYGCWSAERKQIVLCASETNVFLHELCHAAHTRLKGKLKKGQDPVQEIVADLGAEVLRRILGSEKDTSGNAYAYIESYAGEQGKTVLEACLSVLGETAKVVGLILETADTLSPK
ncbi:antirestriction protein [Candidatus Saganbacteria bacterium]|uniref:Antirestriction protein n=1 Tax=Candidatus Saganbacteria bacterium TaxID=2575572 RepID=A0A9D6UME9_UNCSA|nr:antirestriction protein [Candidatus Saganbacteria bacterium]